MDILIVHSKRDVSKEAADDVGGCLGEEYVVLRSDSPKILRLGANEFYDFISTCEGLLGAIVILTNEDTDLEREELLIKYAVLVGKLGPRKAILCLFRGARAPAGLDNIIFLKWGSNNNSFESSKITNWLNTLGTPLWKSSQEERSLLMEMYGREDNYGYTTDSYVQAFLGKEGATPAKIKHTIDNLKNKGFLTEKQIRQVRTFFITPSGVEAVKRMRSQKKKVTEFKGYETELGTEEI
jgi:DNA-binding PadR family transcriptional regulator